MSKAHAPWWLWVIRYLVLALGLFIMGFGIQLAIASDLGTSPISSLPYVVSRMTPISVGTLTGCMHVVFIAIQLALLRREFPPLELLQLPMAFLMATGIDAAGAILGPITYSSYTQQWLLCLGGVGSARGGNLRGSELRGGCQRRRRRGDRHLPENSAPLRRASLD